MVYMQNVVLRGGTALIDVSKLLSKVGVHEGHIVADLGCGGGGHFVSPTSALVGPAGRVYAVDIQKNVLHTVESRMRLQKSKNVVLVWADLEKYGSVGVTNDSCDAVFLANVLFQNKKHREMIREASRLLKTGGSLVVVEWKKSSAPFGPPLDFRIEPVILQQCAHDEGFTLDSEFDAGPYHYACIFKK